MSRIANGLLVAILMAAFVSTTCLVPAARAALIDTSSYIEQTGKLDVSDLQIMVSRDDVQAKLVALGVNPDDASRRIAAMSESEMLRVQEKIDEMAAGGDILAVLGVVLVVLIVLEILGVTNVFNKL